MKRWIFLTVISIATFSFWYIAFPLFAAELSLQQVIDGVNFANSVIEKAEVRADFYGSPRSLPQSVRERIETDLQGMESAYQQELKPTRKRYLAEQIKNFEDLLNTPLPPEYYEYTAVFKRNEVGTAIDDIDRLKSHYSYRIFRVNRTVKYTESQLLKNIPQLVRGLFMGQEIQTIISNGESEVVLTVNHRLDNTALVGEPHFHISAVLFFAGRIIFPLNPERVIEFQAVAKNGTTLYSIEYIPELSAVEALAKVNKSKSTRVWIDPLKGFSVTKTEDFNHIGEDKLLKSVVQFDDFKLFPNEIWHPTSIQLTEYKEQESTQYSFNIHEVDFNISIPDNFFQVREEEMRRLGIDILSSE